VLTVIAVDRRTLKTILTPHECNVLVLASRANRADGEVTQEGWLASARYFAPKHDPECCRAALDSAKDKVARYHENRARLRA
jgi:hypothetical protein